MARVFKVKIPNYADLDYLVDGSSRVLHGAERERAYDLLKGMESLVYEPMKSSKTHFDVLEAWVNHYEAGSFNEIHNHNDPDRMSRCNYVGILILKTGHEQEELAIQTDGPSTSPYPVEEGDFIIVQNTVPRGLPKVNERLVALMYEIKSF